MFSNQREKEYGLLTVDFSLWTDDLLSHFTAAKPEREINHASAFSCSVFH